MTFRNLLYSSNRERKFEISQKFQDFEKLKFFQKFEFESSVITNLRTPNTSAGNVARPSTSSPQNLCAKATWNQKGITIAGGNGYGSALNQLDDPTDMALDSSGNLYIADSGNSRILKTVKKTGKVTILVSEIAPYNLFFDKSYTYLYYTDQTNSRVQKLNIKSGIQTTVAGS
ncbi:unnamed protein product [Didymodactylos carnosus]|uniref:NHL repeat-containing protein n=1 Tax=Didymodactylos carnosus TaxID=1234261 RepID=A0A8S2QFE5_9BILA|nr:unnamed protein product [Didymodactylos carnosus]CAF4107957.1 unnamed protein product [Didymodactylos carnosus]